LDRLREITSMLSRVVRKKCLPAKDNEAWRTPTTSCVF
jgi:hypothetical protein